MRRAAAGLALVVAACGIDAVGLREGSAIPDGDGGPAGTDGAVVAPDGESSADASADAVRPDAGCSVLIDDAFPTLSGATWQWYGGVASVAGRIDLTLGQSGQRGALFWNTPLSFGSVLYVDVDYAITTPDGSTRAEGLAVAWLDTSTPYTLGPTGQGLALCGMGFNGTAVALDSRDGQIIALSSIAGNCGTTGAITSADVSAAQALAVEIRSDRIEGTLSTGPKSTRLRTNPKTGLFGLTSATGTSGFAAQHSITHVKVTSCP